MNEKYKGRISRRLFVTRAGVGAAVGAGCLRFGLPEAIAAAQAAGKPLLTQESLNSFLTAKAEQQPEFRRTLSEAQENLKDFVRSHFHLSPEQEAALDSMTLEQVNKVRQAVQEAVEKHYKVEVRFVADSRARNLSTPQTILGFVQNPPPPPHGGQGSKPGQGKTTVTNVDVNVNLGIVSVTVHCHHESTTK